MSNSKIQAAVMGATGYAGAEVVRILRNHPDVEISCLTSRQYAGKPFSDIFPSFRSVVDKELSLTDASSVSGDTDIVFLALPHKTSMSMAPDIVKKGMKIVDLSADFRFKNQKAYEEHYQEHLAPDLISLSQYGLCEIYEKEIAEAGLIGNPGCYPTSALLPLIPFIREGLVGDDPIIIDSKSGVSGAGRGLSLGTHFCETNDDFRAYKVAEHRHSPEMEEILSLEAKRPVKVIFVPHLVPMTRGMLTTSYSKISELSQGDARDILETFYKGKPFVRVLPESLLPQTRWVRGTNFCDIAVRIDRRTKRLVLISAIDNLVKGAAGQAVQCMNIMMGFSETAGILETPFAV